MEHIWFLTTVIDGHVGLTSIIAVNNEDAVEQAKVYLSNVTKYDTDTTHVGVMEGYTGLAVDAYYFIGVDIKATLIRT